MNPAKTKRRKRVNVTARDPDGKAAKGATFRDITVDEFLAIASKAVEAKVPSTFVK